MHSPAAAIRWEFRRQHRWGLLTVAAYLLFLLAFRLLVLSPGQRIDFDDAKSFALAVVVPLFSTFVYFLGVFTFGLSGDIGARQSMYPARMFTLPVTTEALAGLPMLYGTVVMALLWFATRFLAIWPSWAKVPVLWPALLAASLLAWAQALTWMPYPLRGLRVVVTIVWLVVIEAIIMTALELKASEPVMLALLAPHVPLAYLVARSAVARARRGDVPDWSGAFAGLRRVGVRREAFLSAERAQMWFEWRQHGLSLPLLVAIVLPPGLSLLFLFSDTPVIVFEVLACALVLPAFMAAFVAATVRKAGLTPFLATRPLTSASLIAAKLKVTIWSTLGAWLLVVLAVPLAVRLSGTTSIVSGWVREMVDIFGVQRAIAIALLLLAVLITFTWKQLVQSLYIGMSGREWAVKASVFGTLAILSIIFPLGDWILTNHRLMAIIWKSFPWIAAALVAVKLVAAGRIARGLQARRLVGDRAMLLGAASWALVVFGLYGLLRWILPEMLFRGYFLALVAILAVPLARLSAAPLAVAWNRHR